MSSAVKILSATCNAAWNMRRPGNNAIVLDKDGEIIQSTKYYPYGEPVIEPSGQRYLYGGKEREHGGGRNSYDFGARNLTPYGQWSTVDPMGGKTPEQSVYSYCGGDPINNIDPDGEEKRCLSSKPELREAFDNYEDNGNIIVFAHGNETCILQDYDIKEPKYITDGTQFFNAIVGEFETVDPLTFNESIHVIELHSCNTGKKMSDGEEPIAQKISRTFPNSLIKAPNGKLVAGLKNGESHVYSSIYVDPETKEKFGINQTDSPWRYFYQGNEVTPLSPTVVHGMIRGNGLMNTIKYITSTLYEIIRDTNKE